MFKNLDETLLKCLSIAKEAGQIFKDQWIKPRKIEHKGKIDLVTDTDRQIEAFLRAKLREVAPEAAFLGEESAGETSIPQPDGLCWVVDPVDGTTNFAHHVPMAAISIALCENASPVMGIVNAPILGEMYYAARDTRAFCNGEPIEVSNAHTLMEALVATGFPYDMESRLPVILERLKKVLPAVQGLRRPGAASIDLCWVAAGRLEAFYEDWLKPWDMAAGWLIVKEAGGEISDFNGEPMTWLKPLLATNGHIHEEMLTLLRDG